jgi:hypothetical protein
LIASLLLFAGNAHPGSNSKVAFKQQRWRKCWPQLRVVSANLTAYQRAPLLRAQ